MTHPVWEIKTCQIEIPLPPNAKVLVKKGEVVEEGEFLLGEEELKEFDLRKILKVSGQNLPSCLLVSCGEKVETGKIIAQKKTFFTQEIFKSPISGRVEAFSEEGILKMRVEGKSQIKAPLKGKVKDLTFALLTLEFAAAVFTSQAGKGESNWGDIMFLGERAEEIGLNDLPASSAGKIFILGKKIPLVLVYKAEALGAAGILGGSLIAEASPQDLALLVMGDEDGLISQEIWANLKKYEGKKALISGREKTLKIPL